METNNDVYFRIFSTQESLFDWDKRILYATELIGISDGIRRAWIDALQYLQQVLHNGFLRAHRYSHPLYSLVTSSAPWQIKKLIEFAATLRVLQATDPDRFPTLVSKLLSPRKCVIEGIPFLEIAGTYLRQGFTVSFPVEIPTQKNPDIFLQDPEADENFYIEVSKLGESMSRQDLSSNYNLLCREIFFNVGLPHACNQLRFISEEEISELKESVRAVAEKAVNMDELIFYQDERIDLVMSGHTSYCKLQEWCDKFDRCRITSK